ncbi:DUF6973 domain-containing protein [Tissierella praeacuta]|uniref:DUF6973 domain-containing protein n=1 Tax=Tissierella praeacuta TaxID=43131 RepID=UPI003DA466F4
MKKLTTKIISFIITLSMIMSLSVPTFASKLDMNPFLNQQIDYATIVERLEIDDLNNFIQSIKYNEPTITDENLEQKIKIRVLQDGLDKKIIRVNSNGSIVFNGNLNTRSYGDLPIIKNRLRTNEKRVFNKSLFKGISVLSAAKTAMSYYKKYYNSTSKYEDDNSDAFRHALWMILSARDAGAAYAREFGVAHEDDYPGSALARKMDLFNNDVGINKATKIPSNAPSDVIIDIALVLINDAVKNGELRRFKGSDIGTKNYLVKTNSVGSRK